MDLVSFEPEVNASEEGCIKSAFVDVCTEIVVDFDK